MRHAVGAAGRDAPVGGAYAGGMTAHQVSDVSDVPPTRDFVCVDVAGSGVCIETNEWDRNLVAYRTATALLTRAEAERLAHAVMFAARDGGERNEQT